MGTGLEESRHDNASPRIESKPELRGSWLEGALATNESQARMRETAFWPAAALLGFRRRPAKGLVRVPNGSGGFAGLGGALIWPREGSARVRCSTPTSYGFAAMELCSLVLILTKSTHCTLRWNTIELGAEGHRSCILSGTLTMCTEGAHALSAIRPGLSLY